MRPKISMWSDYGAPAQKHWRSPYRRNAQSSIGPKILLAAVVVVAGVIGISGIYPQIIDSGWMQDPAAHSQRVAHIDAAAPRRSGIVAEIPLPPRRAALTTGEAAVTTARAAAPAPTPASTAATASTSTSGTASTVAASTVAASTVAASTAAAPAADTRTSIAIAAPAPAAQAAPALAIADVPDAQAKVDAPTDPAPAPAVVAKPVQRVARAPVVRKRVVRTEHHRGYSGAYAQWGGGGWGGGGWGSPFRF